MSEWFKTAFGEDYIKLYAHRDDAEAGQLVDLILAKTEIDTSSRILDGPCGAGRHMRAFRQKGYSPCGFDLSTALITEAKAAGVSPSVLVRADLRALPYKPESFDLVVNLFSSLGYFPTDSENFSVLCNLIALCRRGGWFALDFMNSHHVRTNLQEESRRVTDSGATVQDWRNISGVLPRVNKKTIVQFSDGTTKEFHESVRLFDPDELRQALEVCGIVVEYQAGGYGGEAVTIDSSRVILMGRKN